MRFSKNFFKMTIVPDENSGVASLMEKLNISMITISGSAQLADATDCWTYSPRGGLFQDNFLIYFVYGELIRLKNYAWI